MRLNSILLEVTQTLGLVNTKVPAVFGLIKHLLLPYKIHRQWRSLRINMTSSSAEIVYITGKIDNNLRSIID